MSNATQAVKTVSKKPALKKPVKKVSTKVKPTAVKPAAKVDLILSTANEVENLTKTKALRLASSLMNDIDRNYFRLGGVLSVIQDNQDWYQSKGHESFKEFVEAQYGIKQRKAQYLISIYKGLVEAKVPWEKVKVLEWSKLIYLAGKLTPENVDEWVEKASAMTKAQLEHYLKEQAKGTLPAGAPAEAVTISNIVFRVHADQKETIKEAVAKAKIEAETEFDAVALEAICMSYLSGGVIPSLKNMMETKGWKATLIEFQDIFPNVFLEVKVAEEDDTEDLEDDTGEEIQDVAEEGDEEEYEEVYEEDEEEPNAA